MTDITAIESTRRKIKTSVRVLATIRDDVLTTNEAKVIVAVRRGLERLDRRLNKKLTKQLLTEEGE